MNVMPMSFYNRLNNEKPIGTDIRLFIASHLYIYPLGVVEDVLIDIAGYVYLVDFVILDIKEDENMHFILGTPFLTTAKAVIRFDKGIITLKSGNNKIYFIKIPEFPCKIEKRIEEDIDPVTPTNTVTFDEEKRGSSLNFHVDDFWMTI
ncbi:reverse transcriptase domain-containing protein [Tanacetum coccineum]|uniref:Reverse transcriptase domain-containing protein n=1 Tax=Tanacetum coccineum TaxID=301880 RepID=A0ABQ5ES99_9ASTR